MFNRIKAFACNTNTFALMTTGILSLLLLILLFTSIFSYIVNRIEEQTVLSFSISFKETPPIYGDLLRRGISVYYRGIKVGKVTEIDLSKDNSAIIYNVKIFRKNLSLPKNIETILLLQDVIGNRYIDINYPKKPSSVKLKNGDIIKGLSPMLIKDLNLFLVKQLNSGKLENLLNNVSDLSDYASKNKKNITPIVSYINTTLSDKKLMTQILKTPILLDKTSEQIGVTNKKLNLMENQINVAHLSINSAAKNIKKTNKLIESTDNLLVGTQSNLAVTNETINKTNANLKVTNNQLDSVSPQLGLTNRNLCTINKKVPEIPADLLQNANALLKKAARFTESTLGKLVFGD